MIFTAKERQTGRGEDSEPSSRGGFVHKLPPWVVGRSQLFLTSTPLHSLTWGEGPAVRGPGRARGHRPRDLLRKRELVLENLWADSEGGGTMQGGSCPPHGAPAPLSAMYPRAPRALGVVSCLHKPGPTRTLKRHRGSGQLTAGMDREVFRWVNREKKKKLRLSCRVDTQGY